MSYHSFEDLEVWKRGCRQAEKLYRALADKGRHTLRDHVPSNIAEGQDRDAPGDFARFLRIAKGSNAELRTQLYLASRIGLLDAELSKELVAENREISAMLHGLIKAVQTSQKNTRPHGSEN